MGKRKNRHPKFGWWSLKESEPETQKKVEKGRNPLGNWVRAMVMRENPKKPAMVPATDEPRLATATMFEKLSQGSNSGKPSNSDQKEKSRRNVYPKK